MDFRFFRASRWMIVAGAFAFVTVAPGNLSLATAQEAAGQQSQAGAAGSQKTTKNWKDRAEYDLYQKASQAQDPNEALQALNTWQDKYPQSDFKDLRDQLFIRTYLRLVQKDPSQKQALVNKCGDIIQADPNNFLAKYYLSLYGPQVGGQTPPPDLVTKVETAAHGVIDGADENFAESKKPANVSAQQWQGVKNDALGTAHYALAWAANTKHDDKTAENEYKSALEVNPNNANMSYLYAKTLQADKSIPDDQKYPAILFEYARAAEYDGPGSLPASARQQLLAYYNKAYSDYHGSSDGAQQLLTQAKTQALPPAGLSVTSAQAIAQNEANALQQRINSDPAFKLWYEIQQQLTGSNADQFWNSNVKGADVPGGAEGVKNFSGTVISLDPPDHPTKVVLGVTDPTKPDATLVFKEPLPTSALDIVKVGSKIEFAGTPDSYTPNPYMLTFTDPQIPGVKTAPPTTHHRSMRGHNGR